MLLPRHLRTIYPVLSILTATDKEGRQLSLHRTDYCLISSLGLTELSMRPKKDKFIVVTFHEDGNFISSVTKKPSLRLKK